MNSKYFEGELAYLRHEGQAFAHAHPALAPALCREGVDPDVDRMLEGMAFLIAGMRQRMDGCVPALTHELLELIDPQWVRPLPAATIAAFTVPSEGLRGTQSIPAHTEITLPGGQRLRSVATRKVLPLVLESQQFAQPHSDLMTVRLRWRPLIGQLEARGLAAPVRFYIAAPYGTAACMLHALLRRTVSVRVGPVGSNESTWDELGAQVLTYPCLKPDETLWPRSDLSLDGHRLLREYFTLPHKFLFFDLDLQSAQRHLGAGFEVIIRMRHASVQIQELPADLFRLHCVPVVNLFPAESMPLRRSVIGAPQLLRVDGYTDDEPQVYSVEKVTGIAHDTGERRTYAGLQSYTHALRGDEVYYSLSRKLSPVDGAAQTYLSLLTAAQALPTLHDEFLSIHLLAMNRHFPSSVPSVCVPITSGGGPARNATPLGPVSGALQPPLGAPLYWHLLAQLTGGQHELRRLEDLVQVLELYNVQGHAQVQGGRVNARRIAGLVGLDRSGFCLPMRGVPTAGVKTRVEVDEACFAGVGDVFVFGGVLDVLFGEHVPVNVLHGLEMFLRGLAETCAWA